MRLKISAVKPVISKRLLPSKLWSLGFSNGYITGNSNDGYTILETP
jgi:hypothetical protein